jgi:hypothetical protein
MLESGGFMNTNHIVLAIDAEIAQLQKAKALLTGTDITAKRKPGRPAGASAPSKATSFNPVEIADKPEKRRTMSAAGRAKIAAAQKARWAKSKRVAKKVARKAASAPAKKTVTAKSVARKTTQRKKAVSVKRPAQPKAETATTPAS